jgi:hypothetical protein
MSYLLSIDKKFSESTARNHKNRFGRILNELSINDIENDG